MSSVLIIDSEPTQLIALQAVIRGWGHRCFTARAADEARALCEQERFNFDAVLLDWGLPKTDGLDLLRWIKQHGSEADLEVIIQSRPEIPDDIRDAIARGAYYYLTKPYEWTQLRALIQAAQSSRQLKRSLKRKVEESQDILRLLESATFSLRGLQEAEIVAAQLGAAASDPQLGIGVLELLLNGIEHGNLGISYEDKSRLLESGEYEREVDRRLADEEHRDKRVTIEITRSGEALEILISDCGPGFDYQRYLDFDQDRVFDSHGRGVLLAHGMLEIEYLGTGNRVRLTLPLAQRAR